MPIRFAIDHWAAWAPGLNDQAAWRSWFAAPYALTADETPRLSEMPAMMRRRVERLGRAGLQAAYWCQQSVSCPIIFASRYGDMGRAVDLMRELAVAVPLSPTAFSLSVHNAIGALYSIARADVSPYAAVAAGAETVEAAFIEALALLAEEASQVMVVYYDEPLPTVYKDFAETSDFPRARAWACLLRRTEQGGYSLQSRAPSGDIIETSGYPADLAVLDFLVSEHAALQDVQLLRSFSHRLWYWQRHV